MTRLIFHAVGFKFEKLAARYIGGYSGFDYIDEEIFQDVRKRGSSSGVEEEEGNDGFFTGEMEETIPVILLQLESLSVILKLWLRRINVFQQSDKQYLNELKDLKHAILTVQEYAIKPYKNFLKSNKDKDLEEVLSKEPVLDLYCQRLGEELKNLWEENSKVDFEMSDEDHARMNRETVLPCSQLGLKVDFLDRLEDMTPKMRCHRSLLDWVVIFLRNSYTELNSAVKNSLSKELLDIIGFDPLSSALDDILSRARSELEKHVADPCEWAEIYIEDEFKYGLLLMESEGTFPFQRNKTNEWFEIPPSLCKLYYDDPLRDVIAANVVPKENETLSITREMLSEISLSPNTQLLFHGTDHQSTLDILNGRGIYLPEGKEKRDFSSGKGFFLTDNIASALDSAKCKTIKPAILIFQHCGERDVFSSNERARTLTLKAQQDLGKWREIVSSFRSGEQSTNQILDEYDLIEGHVATVSTQSDGQFVFAPKPSSYHMCLISKDLAKQFRQSLHSILFY